MFGPRSVSAILAVFIGGFLSADGATDSTTQSLLSANEENITSFVHKNKGQLGISFKLHNDSDDAFHVVSSIDRNTTVRSPVYSGDFTNGSTTADSVVMQVPAHPSAEGSGVYSSNPMVASEDRNASVVQSNPLWFVMTPGLPLVVASSEAITSSRCKNQSRRFLNELSNYTLWAVEMFGSSVQVPMGIVAGNTYQLGNFDECMRVSVDSGTPDWLQGQYCLATISFVGTNPVPNNVDIYTIDYPPSVSAWEKLQYKGDPSKVRRNTVHWALCVPASCSAQDLQHTLAHELRVIGDKNGLDMTVRVAPQGCQVEGRHAEFGTGAIAYCAVLAALFALLVSSTWYDIKYRTEKDGAVTGAGRPVSTIEKLFMCFSVQRNMRSLLSVPSEEQPAMSATHGLRFFFMLIIITAHRMLLYTGHPLLDSDALDKFLRDLPGALIVNGTLLVDIYFFLGGTLLTYYLIKHLEETGRNILPIMFITRYIRLTPVYLMVILFYMTLLPHLGSGPFWESCVGLERDCCNSNWWTNILYINNYVNARGMCILQSWYLACDFQMFIVSSLLVYTIWRWPKIGYSLLTILSIASVAAPFYNIYVSKGPPVAIPYPNDMNDIRKDYEFFELYMMTHNRACPYLYGIITGLILYKFRDSTFRLGKVTSHLLYLFGVWGLGVGVILSAHVFLVPGHEYNVLESAAYAAFHRIGMSTAIFVFFFVMTFGNIDFWHKILSWKQFAPFGRLTYGAYIVHFLPQLYDQGSLRVPRLIDRYTAGWMALGDCMSAYLISLLMFLLIESPTRKIEKVVFAKQLKEKK